MAWMCQDLAFTAHYFTISLSSSSTYANILLKKHSKLNLAFPLYKIYSILVGKLYIHFSANLIKNKIKLKEMNFLHCIFQKWVISSICVEFNTFLRRQNINYFVTVFFFRECTINSLHLKNYRIFVYSFYRTFV